MAKKPLPQKIVRIFEHDEATCVWTYDYSITKNSPISVEIKYKKDPAKKLKTKKT